MDRALENKSLKEEVKALPEKPGVYKFLDNSGNIIYIGKSVNLRQRVSSYFSHDIFGSESLPLSGNNFFSRQVNQIKISRKDISGSPGLNTRTRIMINSIDRFETEETDSELEALLLEDSLIKKHWPIYNVKQKEFLTYCSVCISDDEFPALRIIDKPEDMALGSFPVIFRNKYKAREFTDLLKKRLGIRTCCGSKPDKSCLRTHFDFCTAPCSGNISVSDYRKLVSECTALFSGKNKGLIEKLTRQMYEFSGKMEFEKAGELKTDIDILINLFERVVFTKKFISLPMILKEKTGRGLTYFFRNGELIHIIRKNSSDREIELIMQSNAFLGTIQINTSLLQLYDRANIIYGHARNNPESVEYHFLDENN